MVFWRRKDVAAPSLPVISMPDLSGVTSKLSIDLKAPVDLLKQQAGNLASVTPLTGGDVQGPMLQGGKMGTGVHIRQGFLDFVLNGNVVDLAVGVVVGMAFTLLMQAFTEDFLTPALGAVFAGTNLVDQYFQVGSATFKYGHFINAMLMFLLILVVLYYGVVRPLQVLGFRAHRHRALRRDCPHCCEEICLLATRCRYCCGKITATDEEIKEMAKALTGFEINLPGMAAGKKLLRKLNLKRSKSEKHPGAVAAEQAELAARFKFKSGGGVVTATAGGEEEGQDEEEGGGRAGGPNGQLQQEEEFVTASDTAGDGAGDARGSGRAGTRGHHRRRRNHNSSSNSSSLRPVRHTHSTDSTDSSSSSSSSGSSSSGGRSSRGSVSGVTQAAPVAPAHSGRVTPFTQGSTTLHLSELEAAALSAAPGQTLVNANGQLVNPVYRGDSALDMA